MTGRAGAAAGGIPGALAFLAAALVCWTCSVPKSPRTVSAIAANDSVVVFDHHVHVLSPALIERWKTAGLPFSKPDYAYSDADSILKFNPADGMFLVSMAYLWSADRFADSAELGNVMRENDFVAGLARTRPGRLFAFCAVDPLRPWAVDELLRCRREQGMYGVKVHLATSRVDLRDPTHLGRLRRLFAAASAEGMPVLLHIETEAEGAPGADAGLVLDSLLATVPPVELYVAHLGTSGGYTFATRAVLRRFAEAIRSRAEIRRHTIWFGLSGVALTDASEQAAALTPDDFSDLAADLREVGLDRVVFGTDYPAFNTVAYLSVLEEKLPLTAEELVKITGNGLPRGFDAGAKPGR